MCLSYVGWVGTVVAVWPVGPVTVCVAVTGVVCLARELAIVVGCCY
jgi:hypothetical protein